MTITDNQGASAAAYEFASAIVQEQCNALTPTCVFCGGNQIADDGEEHKDDCVYMRAEAYLAQPVAAKVEAAPQAEVKIERGRVWIKKGNQSFMLAYEPDEGDDPAEMAQYAASLRAALHGFTPDVNSPDEVSAPQAEQVASRYVLAEHEVGGIIGWWNSQSNSRYELCRAVEVAVIARCRAQGGDTRPCDCAMFGKDCQNIEAPERAAAPADLSKLERVRETYRGLEVHSEGDLVYFADVQALLATARAAEVDARDAALDPDEIEWGHDIQKRLITACQDMTESEDARQVMAEAACLLASIIGRPDQQASAQKGGA